MERLNEDNPNYQLTPIFSGDRLVWVPIVEYYLYDRHPELLIARLAIEQTMEAQDE